MNNYRKAVLAIEKEYHKADAFQALDPANDAVDLFNAAAWAIIDYYADNEKSPAMFETWKELVDIKNEYEYRLSSMTCYDYFYHDTVEI